MNILLVEDESAVISVIQRGLTEHNLSVSVALDGATGLQMAREHEFDVILLDIMLPAMNGIEVCKTLRRENINTPVLMLTALGSTENVITGLDSGADDYMSKPFKLSELYARIRALARRRFTPLKDDSIISIGSLALNTVSKIITRNNTPISLTATEYKLLEYLMKNANRVLSRMEILEHVWGINFNMGTNVVDVYVNYLRKKIDKDFENKMIHTLVGMGYVLKSD
ncbi:response regulator transcription factor [Pinibacter aurantiacus]|uniref:Response regulator transcription factor n=1 Tax=Pinibacter aurantiacus TaxID=2851599 RepID=A0A9E2W542_9BACT|nr:response regulator transcription factor [Pinibacter aurantiacus]MBV4358248.1 response regulator transcription factor [Pinibacter aurantiacus]